MMAEILNSRIVRAFPVVFIVAVLCPCIYGRVIHVDEGATGANNGTSWENAYRYLQEALAAAVSGDEIRVAEGVYTPDLKSPGPPPSRRGILSYGASAGDRTATFQLKNGVSIKGGYAGFDAPEPDIRDIELYETILSGDLNGDDGPNFANNAENSYHVVTAVGTNATAVLDGFAISGGNADAPSFPHNYGGGMYNVEGSPSVTNCTFSGNYAAWGGGMCNAESSPTLTNCTFRGNSAHFGGGMHNVGYASPQIINSTFSGNIAKDGAGMSNHKRSSPTLTNCTFTANQANAGAGGITCADSSSTVVNSILWGDIPNEIDLWGSSITINYCDVQGGWPGVGNIDADPLFAHTDGADNVIGTADDNLRLLRGSPCIDAGDNRSIPSSVVTDLDGNPRIMNGKVDMGAYEGGVAPPSNVYHVNVVSGDDNNSGLSLKTAYATIQKGIDTAEDGDTVLVWPGIYREPINFSGKAITVRSAADAAILEAPDDFAVSFYTGEGPGSILKNFVIRNSFMGVFIAGSSPTICNVTVTDNKSGIKGYAGAQPDITDSIFWNNTDGDLLQCQARYSCIKRQAEGQGEGNISADPLFVDPANGDYHLRSERGRYWPQHNVWVLDKVSSPCIDRGDPNADYSHEPMPNGGRVNMGAYGGTAYASMSEAAWLDGDMNHDGTVNMIDLALLAENWLRPEQVLPGNQPPEVRIVAPSDGAVLYLPQTVPIAAEASDIDGFVVKVEFFADGNKIGEDPDGSNGWDMEWSDFALRDYLLMARATDDDGATTDSTAIKIILRTGRR